MILINSNFRIQNIKCDILVIVFPFSKNIYIGKTDKEMVMWINLTRNKKKKDDDI